MFFAAAMAFALRVLLMWENRKLDQKCNDKTGKEMDTAQTTAIAVEDFGPNFRYVLWRMVICISIFSPGPKKLGWQTVLSWKVQNSNAQKVACHRMDTYPSVRLTYSLTYSQHIPLWLTIRGCMQEMLCRLLCKGSLRVPQHVFQQNPPSIKIHNYNDR